MKSYILSILLFATNFWMPSVNAASFDMLGPGTVNTYTVEYFQIIQLPYLNNYWDWAVLTLKFEERPETYLIEGFGRNIEKYWEDPDPSKDIFIEKILTYFYPGVKLQIVRMEDWDGVDKHMFTIRNLPLPKWLYVESPESASTVRSKVTEEDVWGTYPEGKQTAQSCLDPIAYFMKGMPISYPSC